MKTANPTVMWPSRKSQQPPQGNRQPPWRSAGQARTGTGKRNQSENNRQQQAARRQEKAERLQAEGGEALQHERRFGNKNAAMPVADGEQSPREQRRAPAAGKPRAEGKSLVIKAKKLRLRSPSQDVKEKSKRLREVPLDKEQIEPVRLQKRCPLPASAPAAKWKKNGLKPAW
jgi:23S rRNA pseudouridine2605 synthase